MKKYYSCIIGKKSIYNLLLSLIFIFSIISINLLYFSNSQMPFENIPEKNNANVDTFQNNGQISDKLAIVINTQTSENTNIGGRLKDRHITFGITPFLSYSRPYSDFIHEKGYETIISIPVTGAKNTIEALDEIFPGGLTQNTVADAFESLGGTVGLITDINSVSKADEVLVTDILNVVKAEGFYMLNCSNNINTPSISSFINSTGILCYNSDITIDCRKTKEYIIKSLKKAGDISIKKGLALAACMVYNGDTDTVLDAVSETLSYFDKKNIELVFVSELYKPRKEK